MIARVGKSKTDLLTLQLYGNHGTGRRDNLGTRFQVTGSLNNMYKYYEDKTLQNCDQETELFKLPLQ